MTIQEKTPSKKFFELLDQIVVNETSTKKCFDDAVEHERKRGMTDELIAWYMHDYLRDKINKKTLERWIKPLKELEDSSSEKETVSQNDDNNDTEQEETPTEIVVTTEGSQITNYEEEQDEEPTELELLKIKNAQLEDALHKTEQFKPATALEAVQQNFDVFEDENVVFDWLRKRDNGINIYYFDNYGRELFANRILSQLKNSGVKTFKRLYFEV